MCRAVLSFFRSTQNYTTWNCIFFLASHFFSYDYNINRMIAMLMTFFSSLLLSKVAHAWVAMRLKSNSQNWCFIEIINVVVITSFELWGNGMKRELRSGLKTRKSFEIEIVLMNFRYEFSLPKFKSLKRKKSINHLNF